ncbi:MAG TPA: DUF4893 domain-containing protein, partial [Allosphingosinicella sp.]|nr:DUF4893 domain-containing protein [Allosphingosinicella sp.]
MPRFTRAVLLPLWLLAACQTPDSPRPAVLALEEPVLLGWRAVALSEDRDRVDGLAAAWEEALAQARTRGLLARVRAEGALLEPDAGLPRAALSPGPYRCRLVRLGAGRRSFAAHPFHFCHVGIDGDLLSLTKESGSERPGGYVWPDSDRQSVFLGATALGAERLPPAYGEDPARDSIGLVERIGAFRYRLVFPWPRSGAVLDVL